MAQSPEQELANFLAPMPLWLRKILWHDHTSMTELEWTEFGHSTNPFSAEQLQQLKATAGWQPQTYPQTVEQLRPRFEQMLRRCNPVEWKRYCANAKAARSANADGWVPMPRVKAGRKPNDERAERIWSLHDAGKTSREIQGIFQAEGLTISLEAVEAYLKTRRRRR